MEIRNFLILRLLWWHHKFNRIYLMEKLLLKCEWMRFYCSRNLYRNSMLIFASKPKHQLAGPQCFRVVLLCSAALSCLTFHAMTSSATVLFFTAWENGPVVSECVKSFSFKSLTVSAFCAPVHVALRIACTAQILHAYSVFNPVG